MKPIALKPKACAHSFGRKRTFKTREKARMCDQTCVAYYCKGCKGWHLATAKGRKGRVL